MFERSLVTEMCSNSGSISPKNTIFEGSDPSTAQTRPVIFCHKLACQAINKKWIKKEEQEDLDPFREAERVHTL